MRKKKRISADGTALWQDLSAEVQAMADAEKSMVGYLYETILQYSSLFRSLAHILAAKLGSPQFPACQLKPLFIEMLSSSVSCQEAVRCDLTAVVERDPATRGLAEPFLHYKGFHALEAYRISNLLWEQGRHELALFLNNRIAEVFSVDIHPAARIGKGILIDHATGVVIGETAVVGDDVSLLHEVTLGGTGKEQGDRHPKVGSGVLIGAGAKILGNVTIGEGSKIGAGSVVLDDVPPHSTAAGVPARVVGHPKTDRPALSMDQKIDIEARVDLSYSSSML